MTSKDPVEPPSISRQESQQPEINEAFDLHNTFDGEQQNKLNMMLTNCNIADLS
jgi:hypothetical protein